MLNQRLVKLNFPLQNDIVFAGKKDVLFVDKSMTMFLGYNSIGSLQFHTIMLFQTITTFLYPHYTKSTYRYYYLRKEGFIFYPNSITVLFSIYPSFMDNPRWTHSGSLTPRSILMNFACCM